MMAAAMHVIGSGRSSVPPAAALIGLKAANLVHLDQLGLRVPPALVIDTSIARHWIAHRELPPGCVGQLDAGLRMLEALTGLTLGPRQPLLVSVRSSPPVSMPGMLETVLNVGLTEAGISGLIRRTGNPWLAWDSYRRLVLAWAETVARCPLQPFTALTRECLAAHAVSGLQDLDAIAMRDLARRAADLLATAAGAPLPDDPAEQVRAAVAAVLESWRAPRAQEYRRMTHLDDDTGTGVIVQAMVFGNSGPASGSGVGFTRNPASGDDELYVDFVTNAQGEDVVSGRHALADEPPLSATLPGVWTALLEARPRLERHFRDMQDFEFTVDNGQLYFLQTRCGKRSPWAALRIAVALAREQLLEPDEALARLATIDLDRVERVVLKPGPGDLPIARAVAANVGVASGAVVFDVARARALAAETPIILVRQDLTTDDVASVAVAAGLLTAYGGRTSHAAVVARQLGKACLVGCRELRVEAPASPGEPARACVLGVRRLHEGDIITLDGDHGFVYSGAVPCARERPESELAAVAAWRRQTALSIRP